MDRRYADRGYSDDKILNIHKGADRGYSDDKIDTLRDANMYTLDVRL